MLYLDDIQHTNPELLQKFISLCDAQRRIEGVWKGRTRTYDLRGKKFCVVMAGNPYTEIGRALPDPGHARQPRRHLQPRRHPAAARSTPSRSATSRTRSPRTRCSRRSPRASRPTCTSSWRMAQGRGGARLASSRTATARAEVEEIVALFKRLFQRAAHAAAGEPGVHRLRVAGRPLPHRAAVQAAGQLPQHEQARGEGRLR